MRVCFMTMGSRGDVQPYLAVARCLIQNGHSAIIATGGSFQQFIEDHGVEFQKIESDLMVFVNDEKIKKIMTSPLLHIKDTIKFTNEVIIPQYRKTLDDFYIAAQNADVIVYHPKVLGATDIAEKLNIKALCMSPVPTIYPISEISSFVTTNLPHWLNKLSYKLLDSAENMQIKNINDFRQKVLEFPPRKAKNNCLNHTVIYPVSPYMFRDITSWDNHVFVSGFCFLDSNEVLPTEVDDFLTKKPIVVTFGSVGDLHNFGDLLQDTLEKTDNHAIVLSSDPSFKANDRVMILKQAPHDLLFKKAKAVIHHGGAGTTASALRAGLPQIIFPFGMDQPFWAEQVYKLGCSPKPTKNFNKLLDSIKKLDDETLKSTAQAVGHIINKENGTNACVKFLESLAL